LKLLRFETITFSDATLSDINIVMLRFVAVPRQHTEAHLSDEGDGRVAHGVCVPNIGLDHCLEGFHRTLNMGQASVCSTEAVFKEEHGVVGPYARVDYN